MGAIEHSALRNWFRARKLDFFSNCARPATSSDNPSSNQITTTTYLIWRLATCIVLVRLWVILSILVQKNRKLVYYSNNDNENDGRSTITDNNMYYGSYRCSTYVANFSSLNIKIQLLINVRLVGQIRRCVSKGIKPSGHSRLMGASIK